MKQLHVVRGTLAGVLGLLATQVAQAQYAAPGFPMSLPRPPEAPPAPKPDAIVSPLLARFWHDEQNGRQRASDFYRYMSTYLKYPDAAAKTGTVGHVFVRLTVGPNGRVNDAHLVRTRTVSMLAVPPTPAQAAAAQAALETETLRVFRAARFSVAKEKADTVTVSASFQIE